MITKKQVLCSCGSGKRYLKCCLSQNKIVIFDPPWKKLRETTKTVIYQHLIPYAEDFGSNFMYQAWSEFWISEQDWTEDILGACFETLFIPWFLFEKDADGEGPIALHYLKHYKDHLNHYQQCFIQAACRTQFCFYVVLDRIPGLHLVLQNLFSHSHYTIKEPKLSETLIPGDILFASLLKMGDQTFCLGISPYCIPSNYYQLLLECREDLQKRIIFTLQSPNQLSDEMREGFLEILKTLLKLSINQKNKKLESNNIFN